jgi:hypothetical protein
MVMQQYKVIKPNLNTHIPDKIYWATSSYSVPSMNTEHPPLSHHNAYVLGFFY